MRLRYSCLNERTAAGVARLWRRCFPLESLHAHGGWNPRGEAMSRDVIERRVLGRSSFDPAGSFVVLSGDKPVAFCLAALHRSGDKAGSRTGSRATAGAPSCDGEIKGFLCALAVDERFRRQGIGSEMMRRAESYLSRRGATAISVSFAGNPIPLLGGVPVNETAYPFFLNRGYRTTPSGLLQVMTLHTDDFRLSAALVRKRRSLESQGIGLCPPEPGMLVALDRLLAEHFPGWRESIMASCRQVPPPHLLVAVRGAEVLGYAGPYRVCSAAATGTFHSLGVSPSARGMGIGAVLFNMMCAELKAGGARRISLTTELTNPAQEIYRRAGFRAQFVVDYGMSKELRR
jgi:ribosomal protein S18 acetylase RimI-like enzyme